MWEKPWQNMRSTRETELTETHPAHVVCAWIGNSEAVAAKHYLQVTSEHFQKAAGMDEAARNAARAKATDERIREGEGGHTGDNASLNAVCAGMGNDQCAQRDSNPQPSA